QAQVYCQPRFDPPVILNVEAIGVEDEIPVFGRKGGRKLYLKRVARQEIWKSIVNDLPVKRVGCLTGFIEPVEECAELEGMFALGPYNIVAQCVDVLPVVRLRRGVHGTELGVWAAAGP